MVVSSCKSAVNVTSKRLIFVVIPSKNVIGDASMNNLKVKPQFFERITLIYQTNTIFRDGSGANQLHEPLVGAFVNVNL